MFIQTQKAFYTFYLYTDEELGYILHRTPSNSQCKEKRVRKIRTVRMVRGGYQEPNRIYICEPDTCSPDEYLSNQYKEKLEQKVKKMEAK